MFWNESVMNSWFGFMKLLMLLSILGYWSTKHFNY